MSTNEKGIVVRRSALWAAAVLGILTGVVAPAAAATSVVCAGTENASYSPGLLYTPQSVDVTINRLYSPCVSLTHPSVTSGSISGSAQVSGHSCSALGGGPAGTLDFVITWNTGETSTWRLTTRLDIVNGIHVVTQTGPIIAGKFQGANATGVTQVTPPDLGTACQAPPGVQSSWGPTTLNIVGLL